MDFNLQNPPEGANDNTDTQATVAALSTIEEIAAAADGGPQSRTANETSESLAASARATLPDNEAARRSSADSDNANGRGENGNKIRPNHPPSLESRIPIAQNYSMRSPAVKRLLREAQELSREPSTDFHAAPLEDNLFEWHFTIRGPADSEFSNGIYHGRIIMPPEYPMKPPAIMMLTPNGRFETGTKICLSISNYHPETWRPSWSIRTALMALISFMATPSPGAIGSLECSADVRRSMARKSITWVCSDCGPIVNDMNHAYGSIPTDTSPTAQRVFRLRHEHSLDELHDGNVIMDDTPSDPHIPMDEPLINQQAGDIQGLGHQIHTANMEMNNLPNIPEDNTAFQVCVGALVFAIALLVFRRLYMATDMYKDYFEL